MAKPKQPTRKPATVKKAVAKQPVAKKAARVAAVRASKPLVATPDGWIDAGGGYQLALEDGKLAARSENARRLASVPKELRDGEVADQLEALRDWLAEHERECSAEVERWMLRSLAVPSAVLHAVWDDPAWRRPLENAVVVAERSGGLLRGVDANKGIGVVDLDGETVWLAADRIAIPHPILIHELDGWRELVTQLGIVQGIAQLHRETYAKPADLASGMIDAFEDGKFAMLMHALTKTRSLGYKVRGGFATCKAWDAGAVSEARYWIGADAPDAETFTGQLSWVDDRERALKPAEIGPVAFSEGMRMASAIYAARVVETQDGS